MSLITYLSSPCILGHNTMGQFGRIWIFCGYVKQMIQTRVGCGGFEYEHNSDVIMDTVASQITSLTIIYSTNYSDADQRKQRSSASLAFVREFHRWPVNSPPKWPVTRKINVYTSTDFSIDHQRISEEFHPINLYGYRVGWARDTLNGLGSLLTTYSLLKRSTFYAMIVLCHWNTCVDSSCCACKLFGTIRVWMGNHERGNLSHG